MAWNQETVNSRSVAESKYELVLFWSGRQKDMRDQKHSPVLRWSQSSEAGSWEGCIPIQMGLLHCYQMPIKLKSRDVKVPAVGTLHG